MGALAVACDPGLEGEDTAKSGSDWPSFGRDLDNSRHNPKETALTADVVDGLVPRWSIEGAEVTSTPAVVDGTVYYGDWRGRVFARRVGDGELQWQATLTEDEIPITSSPTVVGDVLFIGDMTATIHALDRASGMPIWALRLDDHPNANLTGSPVVADRFVLTGVSSGELAETKDDYSFKGSFVALDRETGKEAWRVYMTTDDAQGGGGVSVWSSPAVDLERGLVFVGTGNTYEPPASPRSDALVAMDLHTGEIAWIRQFTEGDVYTLLMTPPQGPDADIGAAPNLFTMDGRDVIGVGDKAGVYAVLDRETGEPLWTRMLTEGSHLGGVMTAAAYADGTIYVASNRWPAGFDTTDIFLPNFGDPSNTSVLFALDARDGSSRWEVALPHPTLGAIGVAAGVVYSGTTDGTLRAFDAGDGDMLWSDRPGYTMASGQAVADGVVFTGHGFQFIGITGGPVGKEGGFVAYALP